MIPHLNNYDFSSTELMCNFDFIFNSFDLFLKYKLFQILNMTNQNWNNDPINEIDLESITKLIQTLF